ANHARKAVFGRSTPLPAATRAPASKSGHASKRTPDATSGRSGHTDARANHHVTSACTPERSDACVVAAIADKRNDGTNVPWSGAASTYTPPPTPTVGTTPTTIAASAPTDQRYGLLTARGAARTGTSAASRGAKDETGGGDNAGAGAAS